MDDGATTRRRITAAQWLAARALSEGAPPTRKRIAALLGCDDSAVYGRAGLEGWRRADFRRHVVRQAYAVFMDVALFEGSQLADGGADADARANSRADDGAAAAVGTAGDDGAADEGWADRDDAVAWSDRVAADRAALGWTASGTFGGTAAAPAGDAADGGEAESAADDPVQMLARGTRFLSRRLGRLIARAERGGMLNKTEIDNLAALGRMMERWETLAKERADKQETDRDDKIAEALRTIDKRILRLARAEAERLVATGHRP